MSLTPTPEELTASSLPTIPDDILKAARSPKLFTLGSTGALKHFKLRHDEYKLAQKIARESNPSMVAQALNEVASVRLLKCVVRAEVKYPLIHRKFMFGEGAIRIAKHYKHDGKPLTRIRVYQIYEVFETWAKATFDSVDERALKRIETLAASG